MDAIGILVALSARHTGGDVCQGHAAFGELIRFCEDQGPSALYEDSMRVLEEAEATLAQDAAWLAVRLDADAAPSPEALSGLVDELQARLPLRPPSYWR